MRYGARHTSVNPGFQRDHELLMRERWSRAAGAGVPSPQDERVRLHVLDDCLPRATAPVPAPEIYDLVRGDERLRGAAQPAAAARSAALDSRNDPSASCPGPIPGYQI
jgi:hypothetical protein